MRKALLLILLFLATIRIQGQHDYLKGYLILENKDTINGIIENLPNYELTNFVKIKPYDGKQVVKYTSDLLRSFCFSDNKCFESIEFTDNNVRIRKNFQCIIKGELNLYILHEKSKQRFFILNGSNQLIELYETFREVNNSKKSNYEYISTLKNEMKDLIRLHEKIDQSKLDLKSLEPLIYEYNEAKNNGNNKTFRYKPILKATPVFYSGVTYYYVTKDIGYTGGIGMRLNNPEFSNHLAVRTGVFYRNLPMFGPNDFDILFPICLEYKPGNKIALPGLFMGFSPLLGAGQSIGDNKWFYLFDAVFTCGITSDFYISKKVHLFTDLTWTGSIISFSIGYSFK